MERKLMDYLPPALREYAEFRAITAAQQTEFEAAWAEADALLARQFLDTMDDAGLRRWEKMLKLPVRGTDALETRRARVQAKLNLLRPYTLPWLRLWLAQVFGAENFLLESEDYTLSLALLCDQLPDAQRLTEEAKTSLLAILPENLILALDARRQSQGAISVGGGAEQSLVVEVWPQESQL